MSGEIIGAEKRKQRDDGGIDGKRIKTVTEDDEVEEFFAILRRIQVAVKYFEKDKGKGKGNGGAKLPTKESRLWSPSFEWGDFEKVNGVKGQEGIEDNTGLDLNADPVDDPESI